jgi:hypothetical protein
MPRAIKEAHPDYGIKRVWSTLKEEKNWDVSEKRVKKVMQENGLVANDPSPADGGEAPAESDEKKKSASVSIQEVAI